MKKLLSVMAVGLFALVLASCGGNSPKAIAEKYLQAEKDCDGKAQLELMFFDNADAKKLAEAALETDLYKETVAKAKEQYKDVTFEVGDAKEDGDKAEVKFTVKKGDKTKECTMKLKKVEDKWLVDEDGIELPK